jgi:hypothetical protein
MGVERSGHLLTVTFRFFRMMMVMTPTGTFLVDIYRPSAASISALANLCRLVAASLTPLVSPAMQDSMTVAGLYGFWGGVLLVTVVPGVLWMTTDGYKRRMKISPWKEEAVRDQARRDEMAEEMEKADGKRNGAIEVIDEA